MFVLLHGKVFILMNTWIAAKDLMKQNYLIKKFRSNLNKEDITKDDCKHAQKIWKTCNSKNLGDYHDLYVQAGTLQLADVFKNFREKCLNIYRLDPAYLVSLPSHGKYA